MGRRHSLSSIRPVGSTENIARSAAERIGTLGAAEDTPAATAEQTGRMLTDLS